MGVMILIDAYGGTVIALPIRIVLFIKFDMIKGPEWIPDKTPSEIR